MVTDFSIHPSTSSGRTEKSLVRYLYHIDNKQKILNLMAVTQRVGTRQLEADFMV
jgi:hypothetical protein